MIVVEGPDGSGKTTLVESLVERFALPVEPKIVMPDMSATTSKKAWCEQNVAKGFQMRFFDRHCLISEPIYNTVTKTSFDPGFDDVHWYAAMMNMFHRHCQPLIIYCIPPLDVVKANCETTEQPKRVREGVRKIYGLYVARAASDAATSGALVYDYTSTPMKHIEQTIEISLERMERVSRTFR